MHTTNTRSGLLDAFVRVADDLNAIVITFRGTQETGHALLNWIEDPWRILDGVSRAKAIYGDLNIMVTWHIMGRAMAAFCGLDLALIHGSKNVQVTTFGLPRIENAAFASYYSEVVPNAFRVTHDHDLVPHLPPYY
ncbi:probable feruloyl esterase A isoform X1 [Tanacetum coccineum]